MCDYFGVQYVNKKEDDADEALVKQFEKMLARHEKVLEDNDAGAWSAKAREWAVANGIVNGIGYLADGTPNYAWEAHVTREQMVTMLYRAIGG